MMMLNMLEKGHSAVITAIDASKELKSRFNSFGIVKGAVVNVEQYSLAKQTMEIKINKTRMALRFSEAERVEITE